MDATANATAASAAAPSNSSALDMQQSGLGLRFGPASSKTLVGGFGLLDGFGFSLDKLLPEPFKKPDLLPG